LQSSDRHRRGRGARLSAPDCGRPLSEGELTVLIADPVGNQNPGTISLNRPRQSLSAAYCCSHPRCLRLTAGPRADPRRGKRSLTLVRPVALTARLREGARFGPGRTCGRRIRRLRFSPFDQRLWSTKYISYNLGSHYSISIYLTIKVTRPRWPSGSSFRLPPMV
jgi:hypothetical protein